MFGFYYNGVKNQKAKKMNITNTISFKSNDSSQKKKNNRLLNAAIIAGATGAGAIIGGRHAMKHLPEETLKEISDLKPTITEYYTRFLNCFNPKKADEHLKSNKITRTVYENISKTVENIKNVLEKENKVKSILDTPIKEQTKSYKTLVGEAKQSHYNFIKSFSRLKIKELNKIGIFDYTNYQNLLKAGKEKSKEFMKLVSKPMLKCVGIGTGLGLISGIGINYLINKKNKQK